MTLKIPAIFFLIVAYAAIANSNEFSAGPVFSAYGENTAIENGLEDPASQHFKVVFDISKKSTQGAANRSFDSLARFINMHVRVGVPIENIDLAMVVHGKAGFDLLNEAAYNTRFGQNNASQELLNLLLDAGVQVFICGQSASYLGILKKDLNAGVKMSLSAMTANALLQQQGYTLNPF